MTSESQPNRDRGEEKITHVLFTGLLRLPRKIVIGLVRLYQLTISPHFPSSCRFTPTCSEYAAESLAKYGVFRGSVLAVHRIFRCHPWGKTGYDPPVWYSENTEKPSPDKPSE